MCNGYFTSWINRYNDGPYLYKGIKTRVYGTPCNGVQNKTFNDKPCTQLAPKEFKKTPDNKALKTAALIIGVAAATYAGRKPIGKVLSAIGKHSNKLANGFKTKYPNLSAAIHNGPIGVIKRFITRTPKA